MPMPTVHFLLATMETSLYQKLVSQLEECKTWPTKCAFVDIYVINESGEEEKSNTLTFAFTSVPTAMMQRKEWSPEQFPKSFQKWPS
jgi:hypothetical protein